MGLRGPDKVPVKALEEVPEGGLGGSGEGLWVGGNLEILGRDPGDVFPESGSEGFYFSGLGGLGGGTERRI